MPAASRRIFANPCATRGSGCFFTSTTSVFQMNRNIRLKLEDMAFTMQSLTPILLVDEIEPCLGFWEKLGFKVTVAGPRRRRARLRRF